MSLSKPIEEGKWYRRRDGEIVGPARRTDYHDFPWGVGAYDYTPRGLFILGSPGFSLDLVEEVPAPGTDLSAAQKYFMTLAAPVHGAASAADKPVLPTGSQERKNTPIYSGVLAYFPRAMAYIAQVSKAGNDKHNPGQPMHWSKGKSADHADCVARHLIEHGKIDADDGLRHSGKLAWRALALLETELENADK